MSNLIKALTQLFDLTEASKPPIKTQYYWQKPKESTKKGIQYYLQGKFAPKLSSAEELAAKLELASSVTAYSHDMIQAMVCTKDLNVLTDFVLDSSLHKQEWFKPAIMKLLIECLAINASYQQTAVVSYLIARMLVDRSLASTVRHILWSAHIEACKHNSHSMANNVINTLVRITQNTLRTDWKGDKETYTEEEGKKLTRTLCGTIADSSAALTEIRWFIQSIIYSEDFDGTITTNSVINNILLQRGYTFFRLLQELNVDMSEIVRAVGFKRFKGVSTDTVVALASAGMLADNDLIAAVSKRTSTAATIQLYHTVLNDVCDGDAEKLLPRAREIMFRRMNMILLDEIEGAKLDHYAEKKFDELQAAFDLDSLDT